jgi:heterodisulfide reductase subunit B
MNSNQFNNSFFENADDCKKVECPLCHKQFEMNSINDHIDECLTLTELARNQ